MKDAGSEKPRLVGEGAFAHKEWLVPLPTKSYMLEKGSGYIKFISHPIFMDTIMVAKNFDAFKIKLLKGCQLVFEDEKLNEVKQ